MRASFSHFPFHAELDREYTEALSLLKRAFYLIHKINTSNVYILDMACAKKDTTDEIFPNEDVRFYFDIYLQIRFNFKM